MRLREAVDPAALERALNAVVARHDALRTAFAAGCERFGFRLLQYSVSTNIQPADWTQLASWASRRFEQLAQAYTRAVRDYPGLAEPFALVSMQDLARNGHVVPCDQVGHPLPLAERENTAALTLVDSLCERGQPQWLAGRLIDAQGQLMLRPLSMLIERGGNVEHHRV